MKKLLLSVAILIGATLILSMDTSDDVENGVKEDVVTIQTGLQAES